MLWYTAATGGIETGAVRAPSVFDATVNRLLYIDFSPFASNGGFVTGDTVAPPDAPDAVGSIHRPAYMPVGIVVNGPELAPGILPTVVVMVTLPYVFSNAGSMP